MKEFLIKSVKYSYTLILRPVFFLFDSETIHTTLVNFGTQIGKITPLHFLIKKLIRIEDVSLEQNIAGIKFDNPIGLAAGFDYEAKLPNVLPMIGFGFGTVGTITNKPYEGNPPPMLGRLIKSKSLLVNKGFKNSGIAKIVNQHKNSKFPIPIGISIGKSNCREQMTQQEAVNDVVESFKEIEKNNLPFKYYELNISCPNLYGNIEFYSSQKLRELLAAITTLRLSRPLFIKMPIDKRNTEVNEMLNVIISFPVQDVIFGNLWKDKNPKSLDQEDDKKYKKRFYSGKPTEERSNELIGLVYKKYCDRLTIIGCGGVFSPEDAYKKIRLGASLVELITGLIYQGPQLPAEINFGLLRLLKKDGFKNISEVIGTDAIG
ncbi:MAG: quinone-dependent dihydroorotate dehydrogenase [Candidatus Vogelbacteria bacterium]|nr:quinone-dependent dihydroorotate dehydrogenase [Candidatus Vogelbacteria bacterium]